VEESAVCALKLKEKADEQRKSESRTASELAAAEESAISALNVEQTAFWGRLTLVRRERPEQKGRSAAKVGEEAGRKKPEHPVPGPL
jgi:hypothetical protein